MPEAVTKTRGRTRASSIAVRSARVVSTRLERIESLRRRVQSGPPIERAGEVDDRVGAVDLGGGAVPADLARAPRRARHDDDRVPVGRERGDERPADEARSPCDDHLHRYGSSR